MEPSRRVGYQTPRDISDTFDRPRRKESSVEGSICPIRRGVKRFTSNPDYGVHGVSDIVPDSNHEEANQSLGKRTRKARSIPVDCHAAGKHEDLPDQVLPSGCHHEYITYMTAGLIAAEHKQMKCAEWGEILKALIAVKLRHSGRLYRYGPNGLKVALKGIPPLIAQQIVRDRAACARGAQPESASYSDDQSIQSSDRNEQEEVEVLKQDFGSICRRVDLAEEHRCQLILAEEVLESAKNELYSFAPVLKAAAERLMASNGAKMQNQQGIVELKERLANLMSQSSLLEVKAVEAELELANATKGWVQRQGTRSEAELTLEAAKREADETKFVLSETDQRVLINMRHKSVAHEEIKRESPNFDVLMGRLRGLGVLLDE